MRIFKMTIMAASVFALIPSGAVEAQAGGAAAGLIVGGTVKSAADSIRDSANDVIRQLEQSFGISSFRARQDLAFLIAEVDDVAKRQQDRAFSQLSRQEQQLFIDADNSVVNARRELDRSIDHVQQVATTLDATVSRLPLADRSPRVLGSTPSYLLSHSSAEPVRMDVRGSQLAAGPASLSIAGKPCAVVQQTETALSFRCPPEPFRTAAAPTPVSGKLQVAMPRNILQRLFGGTVAPKEYTLLTTIVPPVLGRYSFEGAMATEVKQSEDRSGILDAANEHCQGERTHGPFRFSTTPGWAIDPATVRLGAIESDNRQTGVDGPNELSSTGFYYMVRLKNGGECLKVLGHIVSYDARAWRKQGVLWSETRMVPGEAPLAVPPGEISWGQDVSIPLPDGVKWIRTTIEQIDGQKKVVTGNDATNAWFSVSHDPAMRTLVIRPRSLAEALGEQ